MAEIKNLLFDLGGVIIELNRTACVNAYIEAGMPDANELLGLYKQSGIFLALEEGTITREEFHAELRKHFTREVSDTTIDECFYKFLVGIPRHRLRALEKLKQRYHIYIVSNTNMLVFDKLIPSFFASDGHSMEYYAEGWVTSFEEHCCKPDAKIFNRCIEKFGIKPAETLFFDDGQTNCDAAEKLGFHSYLVKPDGEFYDYFLENH